MNKIPDYKRHGITSKCVAHGDNGQHSKARRHLVEQEIMAGLYSKKVSQTWKWHLVSFDNIGRNNNNNNGRNGSCLTWLATSLEEKRRGLVINASPRGQCSK